MLLLGFLNFFFSACVSKVWRKCKRSLLWNQEVCGIFIYRIFIIWKLKTIF